MKYTKTPLTYEEQADQLIARGLKADKEELICYLQSVSYYRLSGYWFPFRNDDNSFRNSATLDNVWQRYTFDRQLRVLVMDAIERIEIGIRTDLIYGFVHVHGAFGYLQKCNFSNLTYSEHSTLLTSMYSETLRSKENFVKHFKNKYGDEHTMLPLWMVAEIMPFGKMFTFYRGVHKDIKIKIAQKYDLSFGVLESWLKTLNIIRNICAHHGRLWNRILGIKPFIPSKDERWKTPIVIDNGRMFVVLTILKYMLGYIAPQSKWGERFKNLIDKYRGIPLVNMGFVDGWEECALWK